MSVLYVIDACDQTISIIPINEANYYVHIRSKDYHVEKNCIVEWSWLMCKKSVLSLAAWATRNEQGSSLRGVVDEKDITVVYAWEHFMFLEERNMKG